MINSSFVVPPGNLIRGHTREYFILRSDYQPLSMDIFFVNLHMCTLYSTKYQFLENIKTTVKENTFFHFKRYNAIYFLNYKVI